MKPSSVGKGHKTLVVVFVLLFWGVIYQSSTLIPNISQDLNNVWRDKGQSALWRSARYNQGYRFAGFVQFLLDKIPENGVLVLPPGGDGPKALSSTPFMQFYLIPRKVINCPNDECYQRFSQSNPYLLITSKAQEASMQKFGGTSVMYDEEWGVLVPQQALRGAGETTAGFMSILDLLKAGVLPEIWLALLAASGFLLVRRLMPVLNGVTQVVLGYGAALTFLSLLATVISLIGISLSAKAIWSITFIQLALSLLLALSGGGKGFKNLRISLNFKRSDLFLVLPFALGGVATLISIGKGYYSIDAIQIWGVKGYGIASTGTVKDITNWGTNTLPYPLQIPVIIACFKFLFNETLPASKMLFSGYYLASLLFIYAYQAHENRNRLLAGLISLLVGTSPLIFRHGTIGYANLALGFYLLVAITLLAEAIHQTRAGFGVSILIGIFFFAACWVRPEGWALACLGMVLILGISIIKKQKDIYLQFACPAVALALYGIFWVWITNTIYNSLSNKANIFSSAVSGILGGEHHLREALYILKYFFLDLLDTQTWGFIGIGFMLLIVVTLAMATLKRHEIATVQWVGIVYVLAIILMYYIVSYDAGHDISWWVSTGLDRMMLPGILLTWGSPPGWSKKTSGL